MHDFEPALSRHLLQVSQARFKALLWAYPHIAVAPAISEILQA